MLIDLVIALCVLLSLVTGALELIIGTDKLTALFSLLAFAVFFTGGAIRDAVNALRKDLKPHTVEFKQPVKLSAFQEPIPTHNEPRSKPIIAPPSSKPRHEKTLRELLADEDR
jgi:hypothetical protein